MKGLMKRITAAVLTVAVLLSGLLFSGANIDENNSASGSGNPAGVAKPGKAFYGANSQMWKVSVYVAKNDKVTNSSEYTLSEDYHKFGYTFWLYRDGYGLDYVMQNGATENNLYFELGNKEEYYRESAAFLQAKYSGVKERVFKASDWGLTGANAVPRIQNFTNGVDTQAEAKAFFEGNKFVSNRFVEMAAAAAGKSTEKILSELVFTINGETKSGWGLPMVDLRVSEGTSLGTHTSCVSWVFLYEPVIIINALNVTGAFHGVTATGVAAAMKQGIYNFASDSDQYFYRFKDSATVPSEIPVAWGLGTNFPMVNLPNSMFLAESWLGYETGAYWQAWNGAVTWYIESQLAGGGFGLRYQRAEVPKVVIKKTIDGVASGSLSGFRFKVTSKTSGEVWESVTTSSGEVVLYLPPGDYVLSEETMKNYEPFTPVEFTVSGTLTAADTVVVTANNVKIKAGSLHISKVAHDGDYSGTFFTVSNEEYETVTVSAESLLKSGFVLRSKDGSKSVGVEYTVTEAICGDGSYCHRINLFGLPVGTYTVTEICPARYYKTMVGFNHVGQEESLSYDAKLVTNTSTFVRFDNYVAPSATLTLTKKIKLADIVYAHGTPTFFLTATSQDGRSFTRCFEFDKEYLSQYLETHQGDEWVEMSQTISNVPYGVWTVSECDVIRYAPMEETALIELSAENNNMTVVFTNEKYQQGGASHSDVAVNEFVINLS